MSPPHPVRDGGGQRRRRIKKSLEKSLDIHTV